MMRWGGRMVWVLVIVAILAGLYWLSYRPHTYHYTMAVEVETPQGLKTGSAVREVKWFPQPRAMTGKRFTFKQRGEAVAVDLPDGQTLFALLDVNGYETVLAGFGPASALELKPLLDEANRDRQLHVYSSRNVLRARNLDVPRFVRFRDVNDPASVEEIDSDNLAATFGPGYRLRRITVQMSDKPLSNGILKRLPWLSSYPEPRLSPQNTRPTNPTVAQTLAHGDFQRGLK